MNPQLIERRKALIKALRENAERQTQGQRFSSNGKVCIIGLCQEIQAKRRHKQKPTDKNGGWSPYSKGGYVELYNGVHKYFGLGVIDKDRWRLSSMNDQGTTFPEFAEMLEAKLMEDP